LSSVLCHKSLMKKFGVLLLFISSLAFADEYYDRLVHAGKHELALKITCTKFKLDCKKVKIVKPEKIAGSYAVTVNFTNTIKVSQDAFEYMGRPHQGWLGAIIFHENIHQKQSMYVRQVAGIHTSYLKNEYWEAILE